MSTPRRTTIIDVAREAGVSYKTVSRVLNDEPHVKPALRERVQEAAARLNYHPNVMAQGLVKRRSFLIGLIYENPSPSYVVELQEGVLRRLNGEPYRMVVIPIGSAEEHAREIVGLVRSAALDGVVLAPPVSDHPVVLSQLRSAGVPYARIAPTHELEDGPRVGMDDVLAAEEIATHVLSFGHRHIGVIRGPSDHPSSSQRMEGYARAFARAGIEPRPDLVCDGEYTFESGYLCARALLDRPDRPTALLCQNDDMAAGAIMAAHDLSIAVPSELSLVGYDDSEISRIIWPRITTIRQPVADMACIAADMLLHRLTGSGGPQTKTLAHTLLARETVAPVPTNADPARQGA